MEEELGGEVKEEEKKMKWPRTHRTLQLMSTNNYSISVIMCTLSSSRFLLISCLFIRKYIRLFLASVSHSPSHFRGARSWSREPWLDWCQKTRKRVIFRQPARLRGREILPGQYWWLLPRYLLCPAVTYPVESVITVVSGVSQFYQIKISY